MFVGFSSLRFSNGYSLLGRIVQIAVYEFIILNLTTVMNQRVRMTDVCTPKWTLFEYYVHIDCMPV